VKHSPIQTANLGFNEEGTPVSREFDDVYFSNDNGLEETRYVFLQGNRLSERFASHERSLFVVGESGFGTGLNFLTLWQAFDDFCRKQPQARLQRLHFISFEKFPLTAADLRTAHGHWPELAEFAEALQQQWPLPVPGCHRLLLAQGRITLDLWFGDINELIPQLDDTLTNQVDAWFLDGFAPSKNPDMWTPQLFNAMAKLARPGGTLAESRPAPPLAAEENKDLKRERNYPEQPPTIPHSIVGYRIDKDSNKCLSCHSRANSARTQAVMISITHYMDRDGQPLAAVSPRRYFCVQCHVPQQDVKPLVDNRFENIDQILEKEAANAARKP